MAKAASRTKSHYVCRDCGHSEPRWMGQCRSCRAWNSLVEEAETAARPRSTPPPVAAVEAVALSQVEAACEHGRMATAIGEFDRVLGGGLVPGSAVLLGGDPGIGKSTLALQAASAVAGAAGRTLYVAGEESPVQIAARSRRLGLAAGEVMVLDATDTGAVARSIDQLKPALVVIDSVQTVHTARVDSAPGSVTQLREAGAELVTAARGSGAVALLIGHVTKDGSLAGPRVLEHMVDTVLYFEGDKDHAFRILRAVKNRFGPTGEIGVFEMLAEGLAEVANPSAVFMGGRDGSVCGSVVTSCMEGSRPMLVEVQALVAPSNPGSARRNTLGVDHGRVAMLAAVMQRGLGLSVFDRDIFVSTVGGVRVDEPGADLAVLVALASSYLERPIAGASVVIGEVALTGEVRPVSQPQARVKEARRLGFERAVVAEADLRHARRESGIETVGVSTVAQAWGALDSGRG